MSVKTMVVVKRTLKEGVKYEDFRKAWVPENLPSDPSEKAAHHFKFPFRVTNALNAENPREILTVAVAGMGPEELFAVYPDYHEAEKLRGQALDGMLEEAEDEDAKVSIFVIQDVNELGDDDSFAGD